MSPSARRRAWSLLALGLAVAVYVADRRAVLAGSGHLLFDLNPAEQGFLRVVAPWLDHPLADLLADPARRARFIHDSQAVGNQVHGTLALSLAAVHGALRAGLPAGTLTLRLLALAGSTLTLSLWMIALSRGRAGRAAPLAFAALFTVAPAVLLKLTLVHWGTHEVVMLLHAGFVALLAPALDDPGRRGWAWAALAAGLGALLMVANASLLLPAGLATGWLVARTPGWSRKAGALVAAAAAFGLTLWLVRETGWAAALGHVPDAPLLPGKRGRGFLMAQEAGAVAWWGGEVAARALPLVPGRGYGPVAATLEPLVRGAVACVAAGSLLAALARPRPGRGLTAFLGGSLLVGWAAVTALSQTHGLDPGIVGGIQPRYYAHLYPVALALVAAWAARSPWRLAAPAALVLLASVEHRQLLDPDQPAALGEAPVGRCDASAAWLRFHSDRAPPADRVPLGTEDAAFLAGLRVVEAWQFPDYWRWHRPEDVGRRGVVEAVQRTVRRSPADGPALWQGIGLGLSCLVPPARRARLEPVWEAFPEHAADLRAGLAHPGAAR